MHEAESANIRYYISNITVIDAEYYKDANEYLGIDTEKDLMYGAAFEVDADFGSGGRDGAIGGIHKLIMITTDKSRLMGKELSLIYSNDGKISVHHWEVRNKKYGTCINGLTAKKFNLTQKLMKIDEMDIWCLR